MKYTISIALLLFSSITFAKMAIVPLQKTLDGHLEILASINGVQGKFILDTGATGTLIDVNHLAQFGLKSNDTKLVGVRSGDEQSGKVETFNVDINSFEIAGHKVNLSSVFANDTSARLGPDVVGLIGQDALSELQALLDLTVPRLLIPERPEDLQLLLGDSQRPHYETIQLHLNDMGLSFVDIKLNQQEARLIVDSGASTTVLDESIVEEMGFELKNHPTAVSMGAEGVEHPLKMLHQGVINVGQSEVSGDFFAADFTALRNAINHEQQLIFVGVLGNKQLVELGSIIDLYNGNLYIKL